MKVSAVTFMLVTSLVSATITCAADMPTRKSGLWEMQMSSAHGTFTMQQCVDQASDDLMRRQAESGPTMPGHAGPGSKGKCSTQDVRREGDKFMMDSVCQLEGSTATTHAVVTGAFDSGYRMESKTTFDPPMRGMRENTMTVEAKWLGPCKPGQRPGDMSIPGMPGMPSGMPNIQEMMKRR